MYGERLSRQPQGTERCAPRVKSRSTKNLSGVGGLYEFKPGDDPMAEVIFPRPDHTCGNGMGEFPFSDDSHPLAWNQVEIGLDFHAVQGEVEGDGRVVSLEALGFQHELDGDGGLIRAPTDAY